MARDGTYKAAVGRFLPMSGESEEGQYCMGVMYNGPLQQDPNSASADSRPVTWFLCAAEGSLPPFPQEFASFAEPFGTAEAPNSGYQKVAYHAIPPRNQLYGRHGKAIEPSATPLQEIAVERNLSSPELTTKLVLLPAELSLRGLQTLAELSGATSLANKIGNIRFGSNDLLLGFSLL